MTVVSLKTGAGEGADLVKIGLSDGSFLSVNPCYLSDYGKDLLSWENCGELPPETESMLRFAASCYRAEQSARRLIARAEQNSTGLSFKLGRRGYDSACVSMVISYLAGLDLVNDSRFAERWLRARLARKGGKIPGPRRLKAMLRSRGIGREDADTALDVILDHEAEWALLQSFVRQAPSAGKTGVYSLKNLLKYEGFSSSVLDRYFEDR
jgi:regulatory protein